MAPPPTGQIAIDVRPDGNGVRAPANGLTNESAVRTPVAGGTYGVPEGYKATFLDRFANAELSDGSVGNALLVGNTGNDTLSGAAANDTVLGGTGSNLMFGSNGAVLLSNGGNDTVAALDGSATIQSSGACPLIFGNFTSTAGGLSVSIGGAQATVIGRQQPDRRDHRRQQCAGVWRLRLGGRAG